jgi:hypothetical protein
MRGTKARIEVAPGTGTLTTKVKTGPERPTRRATKTTATKATAAKRTPAKRTPAKRTTTKATKATKA